MHDLDRSVIATLAYYGSFGWPLTLLEIYQRLIPASRLGGRRADAPLSTLLERLDRLVAMGTIVQECGLYAPAETPGGFAGRRIEQEKVWAQKWRRMRRKAWWLQAVPFVRGIWASGSLALGNMSLGSDWDLFVVAQAGRLYTARIGLVIAAWLMRSLRTKQSRSAADKFCFNHYVTTGHLAINHHSLYVAQGLALVIPIHDPHRYRERLGQANQWIREYRPGSMDTEEVRRAVRYSSILNTFRRIGEFIFGWAEPFLRLWQQRRIARTPETYERGGRVVATDRELEFHPQSFEAIALARYNAALVRHGLGAYVERDSGLAH